MNDECCFVLLCGSSEYTAQYDIILGRYCILLEPGTFQKISNDGCKYFVLLHGKWEVWTCYALASDHLGFWLPHVQILDYQTLGSLAV